MPLGPGDGVGCGVGFRMLGLLQSGATQQLSLGSVLSVQPAGTVS